MRLTYNIIRYLVGGVFIFSGLIKVNDPVGTAIKLEEYFNVFSSDFGAFFEAFIPYALTLSVFMVVLEVVLGVALIVNYRPRIVIWVLLLMIVFFTFLTGYSAIENKVTDCGCFGDAIKLTPWQSFYKDIILTVLIGFMFINRNKYLPYPKGRVADIAVGVFTAIMVFVAINAVNHLPYIDFRAYKKGVNIPTAMEPSAPLKYKYIMEDANGKQVEFERYPTDGGYTYKDMVLVNPEAQPKILDYRIWIDDEDVTEASFQGARLFIIIYNVAKTDKEAMAEVNNLLASLGNNITPWVLTASDKATFEAFRHDVQLAVPYYFVDATVLKTMMRANPGLVLVNNGTVLGKWHHNDVPNVATINRLLRPVPGV